MGSGSWGPGEGLTYDPDKQYVEHSDRRGHSTEIRLRIPAEYSAQVTRIRESGHWPKYVRNSDVVVDALVHHLHKQSTILDDWDGIKAINLGCMFDDAKTMEQARVNFEDLMHTIEGNCQAYYPKGNRPPQWDALREYCIDWIGKAKHVDKEMRGRYLEVLEGHLKSAGGI